MDLVKYLYIGLGGALGAVCRYLVSSWVAGNTKHLFPWGTFTVNIVGSFILGLVFILGMEKNIFAPQIRILLTVGFLGAFTTFSTFSLETLNIIKDGNIALGLINIGASICSGLFAVWLGFFFAQLLK